VTVKIAHVYTLSGLWDAVLEIDYKGETRFIKVPNLSRRPSKVEYKVEGEYLVVEFKDERGYGFARCEIHVSHLEKGCLECRNLMVPAT